MKFKEAPNSASVNLLERLASWSYTMVEEIITLRMRELSAVKRKIYSDSFLLRLEEERPGLKYVQLTKFFFIKLKEPHAPENVSKNHLVYVCSISRTDVFDAFSF